VTATTTAPDFSAIKARQQLTWASGDFSVIGSRIVLTSERLAESADLRAGSDVLDIACGSGNAAIAAARHGTRVVGVDYVPSLLEDGRVRAEAEGLAVEFRLGDAEALPLDDSTFDAVLSVFGTMFAPNHTQTAAEIVRVARPGATVALASWTPGGFIGEMFAVISRHVSPPAGVASPLLWGTEDHLVELFGSSLLDVSSTEQTQSFRYPTADDFVQSFRRWYGPTLKAFEALDEEGRDKLYADLVDLATRWDQNKDGGSITIQSEYLESVITLR
jgi:ubiquinone/menaquinone biosynthesis C-methylase UbiE